MEEVERDAGTFQMLMHPIFDHCQSPFILLLLSSEWDDNGERKIRRGSKHIAGEIHM